MAKGKHAAALFEVIHKTKGQEPTGAIRTPSWWFKRRPRSGDAPAPGSASPTAAAPLASESPASPPPAAVPAVSAPAEPPATDDHAVHPLVIDPEQREVRLRLSYRGAGIAAVVLALVIAVAYLGGRQLAGGPAPAVGGPSTEQLRQGPPSPDVLEVGRETRPAISTTPSPRQTAAAPPPQPPAQPQVMVVRDANRQNGLNYVIIQSYPREDLARDAVQVLVENGVPATIEPNLRGYQGWFSVVGIEGYDPPGLRSQEYQAYVQRIQEISAQYAGRRSFRAFDPRAYRWDRP